MKKIFRKAITVLGSVALIGATVGVAAAASYPAPFTSNTAVVYGANAAPTDFSAATDIVANLDANAAAGTVGAVTGESADLASGSDLLYMNDNLNENVQTLTKSDMPTVLADGTFTDDDGTDFDFEQTLTISESNATSRFAFTNTDNDLDDPALALELSISTANVIYNLTATFNKAIAFNATTSEGEELTLFGKTYTVGTATDADTLVLLGGASGAIVNVGEMKVLPVAGIDYDVTLVGLSSAGQASVTVNGDTKTFTQGQTKTVGGVDVYVKTVFRTGDDGSGYAEVQLGAGKLIFETGSAVMVGSDSDDIEGTLVTITGGVNAMTKLVIGVVAADNDVNHLLPGESFVDPVFGTVLLNFDGVTNGPTFSGEKDTGRTELEIRKGGNRELQLVLTDNDGNSATVPFTYNAELQTDDSKTIEIVEGASLAKDEYFILNSGNNHHLMKMTKVNMPSTVTSSDVAFKDVLSGTTYTFDNHNFTVGGYSATVSGQTYTIINDSLTTVTITSSDYSLANNGVVAVYPYLELVSGEDTRVAYTESIIALSGFNTTGPGAGVGAITITLDLPTGSVTVAGTADTDDSVTITDVAGGGTAADIAITNNDSIKVGSVYYDFALIADGATNITNLTISINSGVTQLPANMPITTPGLLFVEDEDKSEGTATTKNAIIITTTDDTSYSTVSEPVFPGQAEDVGYSSETWDDTDFIGWLTNYGTYVWRDTGGSNQKFVGLSYGDDMMYAEVSFAEGEAATGEAGAVIVKDTAAPTGKNLVVVGGSAINSVAATLLGGAFREAAFTAKTDVAAGQFLIESFSHGGKTALLVAGYNAADTENAATYLLNYDVDTTTGRKYIGTSATEASLVVV